MPASVDHAEEVAFGVLEHDEVLIWIGDSGMASRPYLEQSLDLTVLVVGVEVEVQSVLARPLLRTFCNDTLTLPPFGSRNTTQSSSGGSWGT